MIDQLLFLALIVLVLRFTIKVIQGLGALIEELIDG